MSEERRPFGRGGNEGGTGDRGIDRGGAASRARNRTVLLTPETIGQVRASITGPDLVDVSDIDEPEISVSQSWDKPVMSNTDAQLLPPPVAPISELPRFGGDSRTTQRPNRNARDEEYPLANSLGSIAALQSSGVSTPVTRTRAAQAHESDGIGTGSVRRPQFQVAERQEPKSKVVGFLVSFDQNEFGDVVEIRAGRYLVTSKPIDSQDYILIDHETVSALHAIVRATADGKIQILDQLSEFGTGIIRNGSEDEEDIAGSMTTVGHGDLVRFGERRFVLTVIPGIGK